MNGNDTDDSWMPLYKIGAVAALLVLIFIPIQMVIYIVWPPPGTVTGWFALFRENAFIGLLDMDLLLTVDYLLLGLVFLALWAALRHVNRSLALLALIAELIGITTYMASTAAFEMLTLSNGYAAATTDAGRAVYLAAGETMLATWQGTAFNVSYVLGAAAVLLVSVVMLRGIVFSRATAWFGIAMGLMMIVPPTVGTIGVFLSLFSLLPTVVWLVLVARRLWQLGRQENRAGAGAERRKFPMQGETQSIHHMRIQS